MTVAPFSVVVAMELARPRRRLPRPVGRCVAFEASGRFRARQVAGNVARVTVGFARVAGGRVEILDVWGVRAVEPARVVGAAAIDGHIDFARCQREPAGGWRAAERYGDGNIGGRMPGHHCRCIDRTRDALAGDPAPTTAILYPATVVEGGEAPRFMPDPVPAPGRDPDPVAGPVRCPVGGHGTRRPDGAVFRRVRPIAIGVEIVGAGHFRRHVAGRRTGRRLPVARSAPVHEIVAGGR